MISNNNKGNPNHDENGRFTSSGNNHVGGGKPQQNPNKMNANTGNQVADFAASLWNSYMDSDDIKSSDKILKQMGLANQDIKNETYEAKRDLAYKGGWKPDREGNPKNDVDHFLINKSLNNLLDRMKPFYNETRSNEELIKTSMNENWAEDLGYQLKNDGVPEEAIPELLEIFKSEAPSWEEAHEKVGRQEQLDKLGEKMDNLSNGDKALNQMGLDSDDYRDEEDYRRNQYRKDRDDITEFLSENRDFYDENATIGEVVDNVSEELNVPRETVLDLLQEEAKSFGMDIDENTNYKDWWQKEETEENGKKKLNNDAFSGNGESNQKAMNRMGLNEEDIISSSQPSKKRYKVYFDDDTNTTEVMDVEANSEEEAKELAYDERRKRGFGNTLHKPDRVEEVEIANQEELESSFNSLKEECKQFVEQFPWDEQSKKGIMRTIDESSNADELFWGFLFNFYDSDIQNEMKTKFPGSVEKLNELSAKNKEFYGKLNSKPQKNWWEEDEEDDEISTEPVDQYDIDQAKADEEYEKTKNPYEDYDESDVGKKWRN